jgi:thioesterase domain-containing protein
MDRSYSEIVPLRTGGGATPLFCFFDGNFLQMAKAMRGDQSVYGLRHVNLDQSSVPLSLEELATSHLRQIRQVQDRGPYQLIGYSFGGLVAYETATLLASIGENVGLLALVDALHPMFHENLTITEARRFRRRYLVDRIRKYLRNLLQGRFNSIRSDASRLVAARAKRSTPDIRQAAGLARAFPAVENISRTYIPKDFSGRIVLFRVEKAIDGGSEFDGHVSLGWHRYARNGVDIQFVPGGHGTVLQMPNVLNLVSRLEPYLAKV